MYYGHFGLTQAPFRITPDPELFFAGGNRGAVLEALTWAIRNGEGIVKVVGEVGSGKTMLCRMLERELPEDCEIIYLANPSLTPDNILHAIAFELALSVPASAPRLEVLHTLHAFLLEKHAAGRRVVMFVEEAQGMPVETLEELRLLSNLETSRDKLLQIVLFGQPELDDKLRLHRIRQLKERITFSFTLAPLARGEVRDYLMARLRSSGFRGNALFNAGALRAMHRNSRGLLRRINILADKSLLAAYAERQNLVHARHVRRATADSEFSGRRRWPLPAALATGAAVLAALTVLGIWRGSLPWPGSREEVPIEAAQPVAAADPPADAKLPPASALPEGLALEPVLTLEQVRALAATPPPEPALEQ